MTRFDLCLTLTLRLFACAGFVLIAIEIMELLAPERMPQ